MLTILNKARSRWYYIGKGIGCQVYDLDEIEKNHKGNDLKCMEKMLQEKIEKCELTCSLLCHSLRGQFVGRNDVAEEIENKFKQS